MVSVTGLQASTDHRAETTNRGGRADIAGSARGLVGLLSLFSSGLVAGPIDLVGAAVPAPVGPDLDRLHLERGDIVRHRFALINASSLRTLLEARRSGETGGADRIRLNLFDDLPIELAVGGVDRYGDRLVAELGEGSCAAGTRNKYHCFAVLVLRDDRSVNVRLWSASAIYHVRPVGEGPVHVITEHDPAKMPDLD